MENLVIHWVVFGVIILIAGILILNLLVDGWSLGDFLMGVFIFLGIYFYWKEIKSPQPKHHPSN